MSRASLERSIPDGYRLLWDWETTQKSDRYISISYDAWSVHSPKPPIGSLVFEYADYVFIRPIKTEIDRIMATVPYGWRVLGPMESIELGDRFQRGKPPHLQNDRFEECLGTIGYTVKRASEIWGDLVVIRRRKDVADADCERPEKVETTPTDTIQLGDETVAISGATITIGHAAGSYTTTGGPTFTFNDPEEDPEEDETMEHLLDGVQMGLYAGAAEKAVDEAIRRVCNGRIPKILKKGQPLRGFLTVGVLETFRRGLGAVGIDAVDEHIKTAETGITVRYSADLVELLADMFRDFMGDASIGMFLRPDDQALLEGVLSSSGPFGKAKNGTRAEKVVGVSERHTRVKS